MRATNHNTTAICEGCGRRKPFVLGSAFQGDGSATFRNLCASCERRELPVNQPALFEGMRPGSSRSAHLEPDAAPVRDRAQMALF